MRQKDYILLLFSIKLNLLRKLFQHQLLFLLEQTNLILWTCLNAQSSSRCWDESFSLCEASAQLKCFLSALMVCAAFAGLSECDPLHKQVTLLFNGLLCHSCTPPWRVPHRSDTQLLPAGRLGWWMRARERRQLYINTEPSSVEKREWFPPSWHREIRRHVQGCSTEILIFWETLVYVSLK